VACPNTEDGFVMIAVELGAAIAMVDFTKGERLVVWEVVTQMYGKAKLPEARVSPADVAARTNTERAMISKAVRSLVESNVLTAGKEEQTYRLQKDYEKWDRTARKEDPETAEARVAYAVEAVARSNGKVPRTRPGRPKAEPEMRVSTDTDYQETRVSTDTHYPEKRVSTDTDYQETRVSTDTHYPEKRVSTDTDYQETRVSTDTHYPEKRVSTDTVSVSLQTRERVSTDTAILLVELESIEKCCSAVAGEDAPRHSEPEAEPIASIPLPVADQHAEEDRLAAWAKAHVMATSGNHGRPNDEGWGIDAALQAVGLLQSGLPALAIREAIIKAMGLDGMKPIRYARYVPSTAAGMAATLAAKSEPVKFATARVPASEKKRQDLWDAFTEMDLKTKEGA